MKLLDLEPKYLNRELASKICKNKALREAYVNKHLGGMRHAKAVLTSKDVLVTFQIIPMNISLNTLNNMVVQPTLTDENPDSFEQLFKSIKNTLSVHMVRNLNNEMVCKEIISKFKKQMGAEFTDNQYSNNQIIIISSIQIYLSDGESLEIQTNLYNKNQYNIVDYILNNTILSISITFEYVNLNSIQNIYNNINQSLFEKSKIKISDVEDVLYYIQQNQNNREEKNTNYKLFICNKIYYIIQLLVTMKKPPDNLSVSNIDHEGVRKTTNLMFYKSYNTLTLKARYMSFQDIIPTSELGDISNILDDNFILTLSSILNLLELLCQNDVVNIDIQYRYLMIIPPIPDSNTDYTYYMSLIYKYNNYHIRNISLDNKITLEGNVGRVKNTPSSIINSEHLDNINKDWERRTKYTNTAVHSYQLSSSRPTSIILKPTKYGIPSQTFTFNIDI